MENFLIGFGVLLFVGAMGFLRAYPSDNDVD